MDSLRDFQRGDFAEYNSWYEDDVLNDALGPMDDAWLEAVMAEEPCAQYSYSIDGTLAAVIGVARSKLPSDPWVITDIAVRPELRGTSVGRRALAAVIERNAAAMQSLLAYVDDSNGGAQKFFESAGWDKSEAKDESGMWTYIAPTR